MQQILSIVHYLAIKHLVPSHMEKILCALRKELEASIQSLQIEEQVSQTIHNFLTLGLGVAPLGGTKILIIFPYRPNMQLWDRERITAI